MELHDSSKQLTPVVKCLSLRRLRNANIKITLDRLRVFEYPGKGIHTILFEFYAQHQTATGGQTQDLHFTQNYRVQEGSGAGIIGYPVFVGLRVGTDGISFKCYTVNLKNTDDQKILSFLGGDVFKKGLQLISNVNPIIPVVSGFATGIIEAFAHRNDNVPVQDFYMGLDFSGVQSRAQLREGSYIAVQVSDAAAWDWSQWVFKRSNGQIVSKQTPSQGVPLNGTGPTTYLSYNAQTKRIATAGYQYDAAGNLTATPNVNLSYDNQSRLNAASNWNNDYETYGYDPRNQRLWVRPPDWTDESQLIRRLWNLTFYGPDGQRLSTCYAMWLNGEYTTGCWGQYVRFAGKLIRTQSVPWIDGSGALIFNGATSHLPDRLSSEGRHYPYGELRPGSPDGDFATYPHDTTITGFHYANQRYYASGIARFTTPDPYKASAQPDNP